ncbi:hypothetical protein EBO15_37430 [Actinomadura harenae]|uniref:Uncharacterized protein n=2 Tax=Actinomadura harenae TaxID=2483351 RepID=A0A3M2LJ97_9ACTN|nr:hypothetical protein EBO15_37430 [Actinomadura harenae]
MCGAVSQATLDRLVPKAKPPPTSGTYPSRRYTYCGWNSPTNAKRGGERGVMVAVRLSANDTAAKADFESAWQGALQTQGTTSPGTLHSDAATRINGIGDQAFFTHRTATSGLSTLGTAEETVRVRNAVVTVSYRGRDSNPDGPSKANQKRTPLNATTGRLSTDTLAHEVIATLTSCTPCRPRP